ncbi:MAG TPA: FAD/NAD(P)-binding oxidoreductase [Steroidobacteraceae bacterium]|jgi:sulfide dehydrogenase [flavocytochrome c] flavoprotein subunit|nr:FAD/NAD(P)-binding oxidoreductase [Steroidobacteraceae bacterium]
MTLRRREFLGRSALLTGLALAGRTPAAPRGAARVLVIGGGFAGAACALSLRRSAPRLDVTLVDPDASYITCPMSNEVIVGWRDIASITVSRDGLRGAGITCVEDRAESIHAERRRVRLAAGGVLAYDRLVVAPGIRFLWDRIEGLTCETSPRMPHAWQAGAQTTLLAAQLSALRPGGVFAISVPGGYMRCPPGPFERASLVAEYLKRRNPRAKVLIFDANNRFPRQDAFTAAWRELYGNAVEWVPVVAGGAVSRVDAATRTLFTSSGAHPADVACVIPPQAPAALAVQSGLASDHGWCPVVPGTFESTQVSGVHVIGDACIADPMPKAASAAYAQAVSCATSIAAMLEHRRPAVRPLDSVCFSMLARGRALAIRARFVIEDGMIRSVDDAAKRKTGLEAAGAIDAGQEARDAEAWYRRLVADSFGGSTSAVELAPAGTGALDVRVR